MDSHRFLVSLAPAYGALALAVAQGAAGCSSGSSPSDPTCPAGDRPAFHLVIDAAGAQLPPDTAIEVVFGGGDETWTLAAPAAGKSVFCKPAGTGDAGVSDGDEGDAGDAGGAAAIACDLWTSGAAEVKVRATGWATLDRELTAESDACGLVTTQVTLSLEHTD